MYRQNQKTVTSKCTDDRGDVTRDDSQRGPEAPDTLTRFQKYAFSLSSKTHRSICVHTKVFVRFRLLQRTVVLTVVNLYNN